MSVPDVALAQAAQGRMRSQRLRARDLSRQLRMSESQLSRLLSGDTGAPRLGTFVDLCRVLETDPTTMLELAGLWPHPHGQPGPPADGQDHALLTARTRIEAWPPSAKRWALEVVRALLVCAPSLAGDTELPQFCGYD